MENQYYSHGKLLISSEYLVLDGAKALALPTKKGQHLTVAKSTDGQLKWTGMLSNNTPWFTAVFALPLVSNDSSKNPIIERLYEILIAAQTLNPAFLNKDDGYWVTTQLEFPRDWGLGSSSTLIATVAQWAMVNPYELLEKTFGGSGYDLACAISKTPLTYVRKGFDPLVTSVLFDPPFKHALFFIHLNKKQNSRESITHYRNLDKSQLDKEVAFFSDLTNNLLQANTLKAFEMLINKHENRLSKILKTATIKDQLFSDYAYSIKSLGGWGGDFILATGSEGDMEYFIKKGYTTIISYADMILGA